jgi:hypothetical protein
MPKSEPQLPQELRGSQRHLLQLIDSADYPIALNLLLRPHGIELADDASHYPLSVKRKGEWTLERFASTHCPTLLDVRRFASWWPRSARLKWDLISTCSYGGKPAVLLVEAKGHAKELVQLMVRPDPRPEKFQEYLDNNGKILSRLEAVNIPGYGHNDGISSYGQMACQIAVASKFAELGGRVCLLYLGFLGDDYFSGHFVNDLHFQREVGHLDGSEMDLSLPENDVHYESGGQFIVLLKTLRIKAPTPIKVGSCQECDLDYLMNKARRDIRCFYHSIISRPIFAQLLHAMERNVDVRVAFNAPKPYKRFPDNGGPPVFFEELVENPDDGIRLVGFSHGRRTEWATEFLGADHTARAGIPTLVTTHGAAYFDRLFIIDGELVVSNFQDNSHIGLNAFTAPDQIAKYEAIWNQITCTSHPHVP